MRQLLRRFPPYIQHAAAFGVYGLCAFVILDHGASINKNILGFASDPYLASWFLAWWPWALQHHLNPLYTNLLWSPAGIHLAWTTCMPLLSLLGAPITLLAGPVTTFNLFTLLAPCLSAAGAYLLCLRLTGRIGAAFIGGALFGFSSYEMSEALEHLNLDMNFCLPLLVWVAVDRLNNTLSRRRAVIFGVSLMAAEFYISVEVFATICVFGSIAWLLALACLPAQRPRLWRLGLDAACALPLLLALILPLLGAMLWQPKDIIIPLFWTYYTAAHWFNVLVPSPATVLADPTLGVYSRNFFGLPDGDFTTGLPLLVILSLIVKMQWHDPVVRWALILLAVILVASLGPQLWFGNQFTRIVLPWHLVLGIPLLNAALPARFALFSSLLLAVLVAAWVAGDNRPSRWRAFFGLLAWVFLLPSPHPVSPLPVAEFFAPGVVPRVVGANARLLVLPLALSAFWQFKDQFVFESTESYLGFPPHRMLQYAAVQDFMFGWKSAHLGQDIAGLCYATHTQFVIAGPQTAPEVIHALQSLNWPEQAIGNVEIFTVTKQRSRF